MGSSDKVGRRKPHAPSESTRRLLERRRRRSRKHGGGAGVVNLLYRLGLTGRGRNTVDTCAMKVVGVMLLLCVIFGLALQHKYRVDLGSSQPVSPLSKDTAANFREGRVPGVPVGQKRETSEGPGDGVTPKMVEGVDMRSDGGLVDEQRTSVAAAARHQEVAMAARERDHWGKTPAHQEQRATSSSILHLQQLRQQLRPAHEDGDDTGADRANLPSEGNKEKQASSLVYHDPADDVTLMYRDAEGGGEAGPLEAFLEAGGKLPIALLTCNRANLLQNTIESLRGVRGIDMNQVLVLQDGTDESVKAIVQQEGLYLDQNTRTPSLRGSDGATRIARHYKYALDHTFQKVPNAPAVIIVEDDLLFSPDFLEYFEFNAPILEHDESTLVLSAWNDNGFEGLVSDKEELQRTMFFPGLGWLLPKKLYDAELRPSWPDTHWDHWLRDPKRHKGRECVIPEVPRTYHTGVKGTFMNQPMHDRLFKGIAYNTDVSFSWAQTAVAKAYRDGVGPPTYARGMKENYERRVRARIAAARHTNNLDEISGSSSATEDIVFWYDMPQVEEDERRRGSPFQPLADRFGIWHEYKRAEHLGMHSLHRGGVKGGHVILINVSKSPYVDLKPQDIVATAGGRLRRVGARGFGDEEAPARMRDTMRVLAGEQLNESCDSICGSEDMKCEEALFGHLNSCVQLKTHFPCEECAVSFGPDQPCYVSPDAPSINRPGKCLTSEQPLGSRCSASHPLTRRLCPCVP